MKLEWRDLPIGVSVINTSLTAAETEILQELGAGGDVLEIGSAYGYSTVALGLVAGYVTAVDPHFTHGSLPTLVDNLAANRLLHKSRIWPERSQAIMPRLHDEGETYDLVWIDGDHTAEVVEHDVKWARKLVRPGGAIACHDYDEDTCPGVKVALDRLYGGPGYLTDTLAVYL